MVTDIHELDGQAATTQEGERVQLSALGFVNPAGRFEVDAITAGQANGWTFSEACLQDSLPLWEGAACFVDHGDLWSFGGRSVKDLGGVFQKPRWSDESKGVRLELVAQGPAGGLVEELGRQILGELGVKLPVGFSADISFQAKQREVTKILRVHSVDLVFNPARGGAFVRALNSLQGGSRMAIPNDVAPAVPNPQPAGAGGDMDTLRQLLQVQQERSRLAEEEDKVAALRIQMCGYLLDSALVVSKLPGTMQEHVRKQFAGRAFEPSELNAAIDEARKLVSDLQGPLRVQGPTRGNVSAMFSSEDQIKVAVHDMFGVERDKGLEGCSPARMSGIRELYHMLTGDYDLHGGYYPERARLATTADFTGLVANVMNKAVVTRWEQMGRAGYDWWQKIAHVEHFTNLQQVRWLITGTVASLPEVAKGAEYTPLMIGEGHELSSFVKYGGYVGIDLEDLINDDTRKIRQTPRELASSAIRNISELVAALFTQASAVGPTLVDTGALFNSTAVTTAGGHLNLLTTALGTTYAAWETVAAAVYNQPMLVSNDTGYIGTGKKLALDPKFCLVPRALKGQAEALFMPRMASVTGAQLIAPSGLATYMGQVVPLTVPEWTDATDWAAVCDPLLAPGVCIGEAFGLMPEIFVAGDELSPAVFMNDEFRVKVRHHIAVGVADYRPLHKENVAG